MLNPGEFTGCAPRIEVTDGCPETKTGGQMMNATPTQQYLPNGTRVLNTQDGEPGTIVNGFSFDPESGWFEYEVETRYGIERWQRTDFVLMSELESATEE
jgi:hypothetical protein